MALGTHREVKGTWETHSRHVMRGGTGVALETQEGNGSVKGWGCDHMGGDGTEDMGSERDMGDIL